MSSKDIFEFTIVLSFISKYVGKKKNTRVYIEMIEGWKEGRNWVLRRFQQLTCRSYRDEIETRKREEIPYSSRTVPSGLSVTKGP